MGAHAEQLEAVGLLVDGNPVVEQELMGAIRWASREGQLHPDLAEALDLPTGDYECDVCGMRAWTQEKADQCCLPGIARCKAIAIRRQEVAAKYDIEGDDYITLADPELFQASIRAMGKSAGSLRELARQCSVIEETVLHWVCRRRLQVSALVLAMVVEGYGLPDGVGPWPPRKLVNPNGQHRRFLHAGE